MVDLHLSGKSDLHYGRAYLFCFVVLYLFFKLMSKSNYEKLRPILNSSISSILAGFKIYMIQ
jgi:hypothetical protein